MKKLNQSGFHLIAVPLVAVVLTVIGFAVWNFLGHRDRSVNANDHPSQKQEGQAAGQGSFADQYRGSCKDRAVSFTSPPLKPDDLGYIRPLGAMLDGHVTPTDHVYVGPKNAQAADSTIPVLMPADGTVVEIDRMPDQYIGDRAGTQVAPEDHRLVMSFSCRYYSIYIHVHKLAGALATQAAGLKASENRKVSIDLKAGDTVGFIGGSTFDWTPIDTKSTLKGFISPQLYASESWKINTVSPFDLYTGTLKSQLEAKSWRTASPVGGKIDYDQPGKLVGTWFRSGTGGYSGNSKDGGDASARYWDGHLTIAPDYVDPTYTVVSIGNWQGKAAQFVLKTSVDPTKVTAAAGTVRYELAPLTYTSDSASQGWNGNSWAKNIHPATTNAAAGTIIFQVQPGEKLKVETFPGKSPAQVTGFTSAAQTYER